MRDVDPALIAVTDREGRARHGAVDAERAAGTAHERRFARAELAGDGYDVTDEQAGREVPGDLLGLRRRTRLDQKRPSCTAGSTVLGGTNNGAGGATSRPSSSGNRAKSHCKTSSMRGV